jgi:small-conductance mechanosensitive channel
MKSWHAPRRQPNGLALAVVCAASLVALPLGAQPVEKTGTERAAPEHVPPSGRDHPSLAPAKVDVEPAAKDEEIRERLAAVLRATGWFQAPDVHVEEGVVFLSGTAETEEVRRWAGELARNTQDVVAVANRMGVVEPAALDFSSAWSGLSQLWRDIVHSIPFVVFALLVLGLSVAAGFQTRRSLQRILATKIETRLLRSVAAWTAGVFVFLAGTYIVLRVSGLTPLAMTVVGGTGLIGLALGIAFRDITENFLASIFLSMQRPFETGDLVEVAGWTGLVQQLNIRTTVLVTLDGNMVQIPNSAVYKSALRNFTTNRSRRETFVVGIGYDDPIDRAQEVVRAVLAGHPAVLKTPDPWVLVNDLGVSTVNLKVYFWLDGVEHSWLKVRSSVIRQVKASLQQAGISLPDESREVIFPRGVPVTVVRDVSPRPADPTFQRRVAGAHAIAHPSTDAEGGLASDADVVKAQVRQAGPLNDAENLLKQPDRPVTPE